MPRPWQIGTIHDLLGAGKRSDRVKAIMEQVGLEPGRLEMVYVSDIEPEELARTLQQFGERIGRKGEQE